jgi:hypothetical protein
MCGEKENDPRLADSWVVRTLRCRLDHLSTERTRPRLRMVHMHMAMVALLFRRLDIVW